MSKKRKSLTKEEIDVIAQYQWANITDIMNIGAIGRNKARDVLVNLNVDVIKSLKTPNRDPRDEMPQPILKSDILDIKDFNINNKLIKC